MDRPAVLRVVTRLGVAGVSRHAILLTRELAERGFRSELIWGKEEPGEGRLQPRGFPNLHLPDLVRPLDPARDLRAYSALRREIARRRPDIVHTHLSKAGTLGRLAARAAGVRTVIHTYHGHVLEGYFSRVASTAFREVERRLARVTDVLVAVSEEVRDELLEAGIGTPSQWHVVPIGLELDELLGSTLTVHAARARLGLDPNAPTIGIVGRLAPVKDHSSFFRVASRVAEHRPDLKIVVAGDGPLRSHLEAEAKRTLPGRVTFLGWVEDLPAMYAALDVVVLTSRSEGTPVALIEAGAAARPVVATDVGGVRKVVQDGRTGLLAGAGDPDGIAVAVQKVLDDPGLAGDLGRAGREWVRERFSLGRLVEDMAGLYRERLGRADGSRRARA